LAKGICFFKTTQWSECTFILQIQPQSKVFFFPPHFLTSFTHTISFLLILNRYVYSVLRDAGWIKEGIAISVFKDGVAGLSRITPQVKAYESYEEGEPLPSVSPPVDPLV
jgi:hypothetical protein